MEIEGGVDRHVDGEARERVKEKEKGISLGGLAPSRLGDGYSRIWMELEGK